MKVRVISAAIIAIISIALYPITEQLATAERGYSAIGGEEALLIFGIFFALYIIIGGLQSKKKSGSRKATAIQIESKHNDNRHSL